jgi:hypothetical protein
MCIAALHVGRASATTTGTATGGETMRGTGIAGGMRGTGVGIATVAIAGRTEIATAMTTGPSALSLSLSCPLSLVLSITLSSSLSLSLARSLSLSCREDLDRHDDRY